jgi:ADP-heptose:LPS heptosyltransferase
VVRSGALGDTILALPAVAALRDAVGPEGRIELLGRPPAAELARGPALADAVHAFDRALFRAFFDEGADAAELLGLLGRFDVVVAFSRLPRLQALLGEAGAVSVETPPLPPRGVHASDHLLRALAPLGVSGPAGRVELDLPSASQDAAARFLEARGLREGAFAALHPSSGSPRKNWFSEGFRELARLARERELGVLWIEGEADREAVERAREPRASAPIARELPLDVLAALLARAALYFGNDSGVSHLAAVVGAASVALFGPTNPVEWAPRGPRVAIADWRRSPLEVWGIGRDLMASR